MKNKWPWWMAVQTLILLAWGLAVDEKAHPYATLLLISAAVLSFGVCLRQWMRNGSEIRDKRPGGHS